MSDDKEKANQDAITDYFIKEFQSKGIAVTSVSDGHVFLFSRAFIQALLDNHPNQETFNLFIKKPKFGN